MRRGAGVLASMLLVQGCFAGAPVYAPPRLADEGSLETRVQADSTDVEAVTSLAALYVADNRSVDAVALLARANELSPGDPAIPLLLAVATEDAGDVIAARDQYLAYLRTHSGRLSRFAADRLLARRADILRAELRATLARDAPPATDLPAPRVVVLPFVYGVQDDAAEAGASGLSAVITADLADAWAVVDPTILRILLDEMNVPPATRADLGVGVELARRLDARFVVQGNVRRVSLEVAEWEVTVLTVSGESTLNVDHIPLRGSPDDLMRMQQTMSSLIADALDGSLGNRRLGRALTVSGDALGFFGAGLNALDRGDFIEARDAFGRAATIDEGFTEARALADYAERVLAMPPIDTLVYETARIGELQRSVQAVRATSGSIQQTTVGRVGLSERAIISDLLGVDVLGAGALLDLSLTLPGSGE